MNVSLLTPTSRIFLVLACLIVLTAFALRLWEISESVDGDELFSRRVATADARTGLKLVEEDLVHPPLYYFVLKVTSPLTGDTTAGIRTLSLLSGTASIVVVLLFGVLRPGLRLPVLAAAAWLSLNELHIYYSQHARSYAFYGFLLCLFLLWAFILVDQNGVSLNKSFWVIGTVLMCLLVYTHYVGALFIAAAVFAIWITRVDRKKKLLATVTAASAALLFLPWVLTEIPVLQARHGVSSNLGWQGLPTWYDLRAIWAKFLGVPPVRGGTILSLSMGVLLVGLCVVASFKTERTLSRQVVTILLFTAVLPPLLLFATTFKPLELTVFGDRHLLPAMFSWLLLAAVGLAEATSILPKPKLLFSIAVSLLCVVQIVSWSPGSRRHPYSVIATDLRKAKEQTNAPVYTTWPYGIGEPVNFYLKADVVRPLPAPGEASANNIDDDAFIILYRPDVSTEKHRVDALLHELPNARKTCRYYSSRAEGRYGTEMCIVLPK